MLINQDRLVGPARLSVSGWPVFAGGRQLANNVVEGPRRSVRV